MFAWLKRKTASPDPDSRDALAEALLRAGTEMPEIHSVSRREGLSFDVRPAHDPDLEVRSNADNLWLHRSQATPGERPAMVARFAASWVEGTRGEAPDPARFLLLLRHTGYTQVGQGAQAAWCLPQGGDLAVMLAEDLPNSVRMVTVSQVAELGLDDAGVIALCQGNWAKRKPRLRVEELADDFLLLTIPDDPWLTGSAVPMGDVGAALAARGLSEALLIYPARDQIFATPADRPDAVPHLAAMFQPDLAHRQSDFIWRWSAADGFAPVLQPDGEGGFAPMGGPDA